MPERGNPVHGIKMVPLTTLEKKGELKISFEIAKGSRPSNSFLTSPWLSGLIEKTCLAEGTKVGFVELKNTGYKLYSLDIHPFVYAPEEAQDLLMGKRFGEKLSEMALVEARKRLGEVKISPYHAGTSGPMQKLLKRWGVKVRPSGSFEAGITGMIEGARKSLNEFKSKRSQIQKMANALTNLKQKKAGFSYVKRKAPRK
ncbi:MAG: hypothetical protein V1494_06830 [Candidatus Diapherotrites archaeon]